MEAPQSVVNIFHMFMAGITLCCLTLSCCPSWSCMVLKILPLPTLLLERLSHPQDTSLNWVAVKHVLWSSQGFYGTNGIPICWCTKALCWLLLKLSLPSMIDCNFVFHDRQWKQNSENSNGPTVISINSSFSFPLDFLEILEIVQTIVCPPNLASWNRILQSQLRICYAIWIRSWQARPREYY